VTTIVQEPEFKITPQDPPVPGKVPPLKVMGWGYGFSSSEAAYNDSVYDAYAVIGASKEDLGPSLNIKRFFATKAYSQKFSVTMSLLVNPENDLYGIGISSIFNIIKLGNFYTSASTYLGSVDKRDFLSGQAMGISLLQSVNFGGVDIYAGLNYTHGSIGFTADVTDKKFDRFNYDTELGQDYHFGLGLYLDKKL